MSIRIVLGAGRLRIVRHCLAESALIAVLAGVVGVIFAFCGIAVLRPLLPSEVRQIQEPTVNLRVLGFTLISSLFAVGIIGIFPALRISRTGGIDTTRLEGQGLSAGRSRRRVIGSLVASEVALTLILLIGTGLMIRSAARLLRVDPGFNPTSLLTMTISLPNNKFEWKHNVVFSRQVIESIKSLPEVRDAAVIQGVPMHSGSFWASALARNDPHLLFRNYQPGRLN
jgi:putative ABC transport system permease protein